MNDSQAKQSKKSSGLGTVTGTKSLSSDRNQPQLESAALPPILLTLAMVSIVLLIIVGGALLCLPELAQSRWVWPLKPFNTRFLGAIYLSALVGLASMVLSERGALARLIVPMMWVFTTVVLMVSCLQLQQFDAARKTTDIWFWLYLVDCVGASYYWGYFRNHSFAGLRKLPAPWAVGLGIQSGILGAYGLSLLFAPVATGEAWLWPLDVFHAQLYSSIFLTGAVGSGLLARWATAAETRALGAVQITFSSLVLLGIWLVDREVQMLDWGLLVNWAWIGAIALLGLTGLGLLTQANRITNP
ncbi:MAG: hypothetical protein AAFO84_17010 [Cyanobacteria bacterium J06598_1]